ncbi:glycoside hydrolase family 43 protein [Thermobifida alba]|uniref:Glycoside hydrolase family 43 protein n=1 Tax=Thermobifida alba TaxID=53522 RepID=A0ABY4KZ87_THEAE|nr:glycoside hydrolase family 43 protein [Thermobifida alba]UPT20741.1 glycoside hydrolase family 43 protein [Thermobifida alba]
MTSPQDTSSPSREEPRAGIIRNPVLTGFYPDPSILRVGDDYYVATSTFEWSPGVTLHHSRDLVHWRSLGGALTEKRLLDLTGRRDSAGVWAPALSYRDGLFFLVYTNVESYSGNFWDSPNYVTTAPDITGPWSDPVPLHSLGFDPSLFHDDDGRSWLLSPSMDWRPGHDAFGGIVAQEFSVRDMKLVGEPKMIFTGTEIGVTEAPHIYKRDGWYYLVTAEGGTQWEHQVTVARSRSVTGPYEVDPAGPTLTSRHVPEAVLQRAGHASLVETQHGEWYLAHLTGRPLPPSGRCVLGRETALQKIEWSPDGWPRVRNAEPLVEVPGPRGLAAHPWPQQPETDHFDGAELRPEWSTLRRHFDPSWASLTERPGYLRIRGGSSPSGLHGPSMVARRLQHHACVFEACLEYDPQDFRQMAGITAYYNTRQWHYLRVNRDDRGGVFAGVLTSDRGRISEVGRRVSVTGWPRVFLRAEIDRNNLRFAVSSDGSTWADLGVRLDMSILSDEYAEERFGNEPIMWGFTGAFLGLWSHDMTGAGLPADFDFCTYRPQSPS